MIAIIGIMIGFYIITRCASMGASKSEPMVVKLLCLVTFIITLLSIGSLFLIGGSMDGPM